MNISFNFNDKSREELEEIAKEVAAEKAKLTVEELEKENQKLQEDFEKLLIAAEKNVAEKQKRIDQKKIDQFRVVCSMAIQAAKDFDLNVEVKDSSNELYGVIKFQADSIMIVGAAPKSLKKRFCQVLEAADEILIDNKGDKVEIMLSYDFV